MTFVPASGILIGFGEGEHFRFTDEFADENHTRWDTCGGEPVSNNDGGCSGEIAESGIDAQDAARVRRAASTASTGYRTDIHINVGHRLGERFHDERAHALRLYVLGGWN